MAWPSEIVSLNALPYENIESIPLLFLMFHNQNAQKHGVETFAFDATTRNIH